MADPVYHTDTWNGLPHYCCRACGYDTMLLSRITDHVASCPAAVAVQQTPTPAEESLSQPPDSAGPRPEPPPAPEPAPVPVPVPDDDEDDEPGPEVQA